MRYTHTKVEEVNLHHLQEKGFYVSTRNRSGETLEYRQIRQIAIGRLDTPGGRETTVMDLILEKEGGEARLLRLCPRRFNPTKLVPVAPSTDLALMTIIATLQRESGCRIVPDEAVLSNGRPSTFVDVGAFEQAIYGIHLNPKRDTDWP